MLINRKIGLPVAIALIASAAVSGFGLYGLTPVNASMVEIAYTCVPALLRVSEMRSN